MVQRKAKFFEQLRKQKAIAQEILNKIFAKFVIGVEFQKVRYYTIKLQRKRRAITFMKKFRLTMARWKEIQRRLSVLIFRFRYKKKILLIVKTQRLVR